jgi:radical SAM superfamily enzyme YgiQ (UPF0313 family)
MLPPSVPAVDSFRILPNSGIPAEFPPLGPNLNVLLIWPHFPPSFWGFEGVLEMIPERSMTPPLSLITLAALCPPSWNLRLIDRAFEELRDEDLQWANLVMVSAMHAQRTDALECLARARRLGRRTFIGGPWASSEPDVLTLHADHVLVGEAEEAFAGIAKALENGSSHSIYRIIDKPDISQSPIPRFDLLRLDKYASMPVQFSRGCPFQCEFCDIITIYGRRPRTKSSAQLIAELDTLRLLGWRNEVFIVDDNFIGNHKQALQLAQDLAVWGDQHNHPFSFYTEASIDLADKTELLAAMVEANFMYVFIGIETPSSEALKGSKKFQNLRSDNVQQIRTIQESGLWVLGGFIVGFDSDDETIFDRQLEFIDRTAIAWAMAGVLQAPPTTPLYERMKKEGRLIKDSQATTNFSPPNFRTVLPLPVLLGGLGRLLLGLYEPKPFFKRAFHSLEVWRPRPTQIPPNPSTAYTLRVLFWSMWKQGLRSNYKLEYWRFLGRMLANWSREPAKIWLGLMILLSAHHFLYYARQVADDLEQECRALKSAEPTRRQMLATKL